MGLGFRNYLLILGIVCLVVWGVFFLFVYNLSLGFLAWIIPGVVLVIIGLLNWRSGEDISGKSQVMVRENSEGYGPHEGW